MIMASFDIEIIYKQLASSFLFFRTLKAFFASGYPQHAPLSIRYARHPFLFLGNMTGGRRTSFPLRRKLTTFGHGNNDDRHTSLAMG